MGGRIVVALAATAALVGSGLAWATVRSFTSNIQHGAALPAAPAPRVPGQRSASASDVDGRDQNVLLLGNDSVLGATPRELAALGTTADRDSQATDTMMVMHLPADGSRATVISFPRDSWVPIPGVGSGKLNSAYADAYVAAKQRGLSTVQAESAGVSLTAATISALTGLHIDHYVQINLLGFYDISEAIGGVDVCLNAAQNKSTEGDASHPNGYTGINLKAGWNYNVKGLQAEAFVRQRHGRPRSDLDRIVRQQYFLSAVFKKATSAGMLLNPLKLQSVLNAVSKSLFTDPSLDVLKLVQQFQKIAAGNISFAQIPIVRPDGTSPDGQSIVVVDPDVVRQKVAGWVGVPSDPKLTAAEPVPPNTVSVQVQNASSQNGTAKRNSDVLRQVGFAASSGDAPSAHTATTIEYPDGLQAQAKTLAAYVPGATVMLTSGISQLTLVLGQDGIGVRLPSAGRSPAATKPPVNSTAGTTTAAQNAAGCIN